jgi:hypothetical protein
LGVCESGDGDDRRGEERGFLSRHHGH